MTQMNVRIDADIKAAGDEAFASIGCTPSHVVQAIWNYAARNRHDKKALRRLNQMVEKPIDEEAQRNIERRLELVRQGPQLYLNMLKKMGIEGVPEPLDISDEELLYEAYLDRMAEKGMPL